MKQLILTGGVIICALIFLPRLAQASILYLDQIPGSIAVGQTFTVNLNVDTEGQAVNAVQANVVAGSNLEVIGAKSGPVFYLIAPGSPSSTSSTASFGAGAPTPGYTGSAGLVGTITLKAVALGPANIAISSGHVLLNDGLGTESLHDTRGGQIQVTPAATAAPVISSSTDSNQNGWYASPNVSLSWSAPAGAIGYSYSLDQKRNSDPGDSVDTAATAKSYRGLADGVWYFHVKAKSDQPNAPFSAVTNFRIQIDTVAPLPFQVSLIGQTDLRNVSRTPQISFNATDSLSGIDHYAIFLDGSQVAAVARGNYTFRPISPGPHTFTVKAFDHAGNFSQDDLSLIISASAFSLTQQLNMPIYLLLFSNLVLMLLVLGLLWWLFRNRRGIVRASAASHLVKIESDLEKKMDQLRHEADRKIASLGPIPGAAALRKEIDHDLAQAELKVDQTVKKYRHKDK